MSRYLAIVRLLLLLVVPLILAFMAYRFMVGALLEPANPASPTEVSIEISPGMSFREVARLLQSKGIVRYARSLDLLARLKGSPTDKISAGEYMLSPAQQPSQILAKLVAGDVLKRNVTLTEGMNMYELTKAVGRSGLMSEAEFLPALSDQNVLAKAGIAAKNFEGYLYPETYTFSRPTTAAQIIWRMLEAGEKHWPMEYTNQADKLGLSRHEILTLASIIEKESGKKKDDQPIISSVFHNRLKAGMKLQADPTVIYGLENFNGNLTKEDLQNPHPYNTYVNLGLPPGPIANPGDSAVKAALFPAETQFLFFVADGLGGHTFSQTLSEHNEAVAKFLSGETPVVEPTKP